MWLGIQLIFVRITIFSKTIWDVLSKLGQPNPVKAHRRLIPSESHQSVARNQRPRQFMSSNNIMTWHGTPLSTAYTGGPVKLSLARLHRYLFLAHSKLAQNILWHTTAYSIGNDAWNSFEILFVKVGTNNEMFSTSIVHCFLASLWTVVYTWSKRHVSSDIQLRHPDVINGIQVAKIP